MPLKRGSALEVILACRDARLPNGPLSTSQKSVLLALATHHPKIFPSQDSLAAEASVHRRTAIRALDALEAGGLITRHRGWQHKPTVYRLNLRAIRESRFADEPTDDTVWS